MAEYKDRGNITLYMNKTDNPKAPVLKGTLYIDDVTHRASLWIKTDRETGEPILDESGNKIFGGKVQVEAGAAGPPDHGATESDLF